MLKILISFLGVAAPYVALAADLPRPSPEFVLNQMGGKQELLSSYKGKVCLVEFLFTTCPHCQHTAGVLSKLQAEFGPRGFQALGVAFNEMSSMLVPDFVREHGAKFPVAWAQREQVLSYLHITPMERFVVPQIVIIDRKGQIRMQSPPLGDAKLQEEANLRIVIDGMLKEGAPPTAAHPVSSAAKKK